MCPFPCCSGLQACRGRGVVSRALPRAGDASDASEPPIRATRCLLALPPFVATRMTRRFEVVGRLALAWVRVGSNHPFAEMNIYIYIYIYIYFFSLVVFRGNLITTGHIFIFFQGA